MIRNVKSITWNKLSNLLQYYHKQIQSKNHSQHSSSVYKFSRDYPIRILKYTSYLYGISIYLRSRYLSRYKFNPPLKHHLNIPTLCIGNAVVGGSGKTPFVDYILTLLLSTSCQKTLILISNGYANDEISFLKHKYRWNSSRILFAVGSNRHLTVSHILKQNPALNLHNTLGIMDDGLQNGSIIPHTSVLLVNALSPLGSTGYLIPAGTLREPLLQSIQRVKLVILHNSNLISSHRLKVLLRFFHKLNAKCSDAQSRKITTSSIQVNALLSINTSNQSLTQIHLNHHSPSFSNGVVAFCAIANPQGFQTLLHEYLTPHSILDFIPFVDHHQYTFSDLEFISNRALQLNVKSLILTEKDWYRNPSQLCAYFNSKPTLNLFILQVHFVPTQPQLISTFIHQCLIKT